jgi:hypothetical protein
MAAAATGAREDEAGIARSIFDHFTARLAVRARLTSHFN